MSTTPTQRLAVVTRSSGKPVDSGQYLSVVEGGLPVWTEDLASATAFDSMREATRAALRLPGSIRAFALPLKVERTTRASLH